jgi:hypothetical protein
MISIIHHNWTRSTLDTTIREEESLYTYIAYPMLHIGAPQRLHCYSLAELLRTACCTILSLGFQEREPQPSPDHGHEHSQPRLENAG